LGIIWKEGSTPDATMSDLVHSIAKCLAEFDRKDFSSLNIADQTPYAARAIMVAHVVRELGVQSAAISDFAIVMHERREIDHSLQVAAPRSM